MKTFILADETGVTRQDSNALRVSQRRQSYCWNVLRAVSINSDSLIGLATKGASFNSGGSVSREYPLITTKGTPRPL